MFIALKHCSRVTIFRNFITCYHMLVTLLLTDAKKKIKKWAEMLIKLLPYLCLCRRKLLFSIDFLGLMFVLLLVVNTSNLQNYTYVIISVKGSLTSY